MLDNVARLDAGAVPLILRMQETGLQVDLSHFHAMEKVLSEDLERLTDEVADMTGLPDQLWTAGTRNPDLLFKKHGAEAGPAQVHPQRG
jgi:hypothetical protein